jgi:hypothetical protein
MTQALALVPVLALLLALFSSIGGFTLFYASSVRKKYAAERAFDHIRASQLEQSRLIVSLDDKIEELRVEIVRLAGKLPG